jgi:hypothetical protein
VNAPIRLSILLLLALAASACSAAPPLEPNAPRLVRTPPLVLADAAMHAAPSPLVAQVRQAEPVRQGTLVSSTPRGQH